MTKTMILRHYTIAFTAPTFNMAASMRRSLLNTIQVQLSQVRYRRPNIQKPRPGIRERRLFEAITVPILRPSQVTEVERCRKEKIPQLTKKAEPNPYGQFLLQQCKKMLASYKMVIVCQVLPLSENEKREVTNKLKKKNMNLRFFSNTLMRTAVSDTRLMNLAPYFCGNNLYVVSEEPQVAEMVKIIRRVPQLHILGGVVDNYILNKEDLMKCAKLPPLDIVQGELASILNMSAAKTHSLLGSHQEKLSRNLEQYVKDRQEAEEKS